MIPGESWGQNTIVLPGIFGQQKTSRPVDTTNGPVTQVDPNGQSNVARTRVEEKQHEIRDTAPALPHLPPVGELPPESEVSVQFLQEYTTSWWTTC